MARHPYQAPPKDHTLRNAALVTAVGGGLYLIPGVRKAVNAQAAKLAKAGEKPKPKIVRAKSKPKPREEPVNPIAQQIPVSELRGKKGIKTYN